VRWSHAFIPTLRDDPADAEAANHRLLVRAGFIRQLMAGSYSLLPLGMKVATKISAIIREEMSAIGGQEFLLPVVHPAEPWKRSGRWDDVEGILVKFRDRRGVDMMLAMSHEEIFTLLAAEMRSYRDLPQLWYHLQTKFRDEPRPKAGLLRVREFVMKDSYSFDVDRAGLDRQFDNHHGAYSRIFARLGLPVIPVEASSGSMGGSESVEFTVPSPAGEDDIVVCPTGDYAGNVERATSRLDPVEDPPGDSELAEFPTPGIRTIAALADGFDFAAAPRQIKTLVYIVDDEPTLVLVRGDHDLMEQKLVDGLGTAKLRPAAEEEIRPLLGAGPGSLGAVGVTGIPVVADLALQDRRGLVTGANRDDVHVRGVDVARDITVDRWLDLRRVREGDPCPRCGTPLRVERVIEVGHIFKLGTFYSEPLDATVLDENGVETPIFMGSYGVGIGRSMAAIVETHHDDKGIVWPVAVAPYEVVISLVKVDDEPSAEAAEGVYQDLVDAGIDVILDDRDLRPGVKFTDAELVGFPFRVTIGPRGVGAGEVELTERASGMTETLKLEDAVAVVVERVSALR
jgi:prolyl-tRNA synthetase